MAREAARRRFFVEAIPAGGEVALPPEEAHHALRVLRLRAGDAVELFDGRGGVAAGRIALAERGRAAVEVQSVGPAAPRVGPAVHLAFAVPKGKRLDWLLEKATELGAASLRAVVFARSVAGGEELTPARRRRWQGHCVAAAKQCGLDLLPGIEPTTDVEGLLAASSGRLGLLGAASDDARALPDALARRDGRDVVVAVGPEGGLCDDEVERFAAAGFVPVRLGWTVLRTETAAVALLAAVTALAG